MLETWVTERPEVRYLVTTPTCSRLQPCVLPPPAPLPPPPCQPCALQVTEAERTTLTGLCANFSLWLEEVEAKQAELPLYEAPAYLSAQVTTTLEARPWLQP